jgi:hypothetical protein
LLHSLHKGWSNVLNIEAAYDNFQKFGTSHHTCIGRHNCSGTSFHAISTHVYMKLICEKAIHQYIFFAALMFEKSRMRLASHSLATFSLYTSLWVYFNSILRSTQWHVYFLRDHSFCLFCSKFIYRHTFSSPEHVLRRTQRKIDCAKTIMVWNKTYSSNSGQNKLIVGQMEKSINVFSLSDSPISVHNTLYYNSA